MRTVLFDLGNTLDAGYRKPHCAPFERALMLLGTRAEEALFVGDGPRWDVIGAEAAGIRPILVQSTGTDSAGGPITVTRTLQDVLAHVQALIGEAVEAHLVR